MLASIPASILNHIGATSGSPFASEKISHALAVRCAAANKLSASLGHELSLLGTGSAASYLLLAKSPRRGAAVN
jgi:hypothetical protein